MKYSKRKARTSRSHPKGDAVTQVGKSDKETSMDGGLIIPLSKVMWFQIQRDTGSQGMLPKSCFIFLLDSYRGYIGITVLRL